MHLCGFPVQVRQFELQFWQYQLLSTNPLVQGEHVELEALTNDPVVHDVQIFGFPWHVLQGGVQRVCWLVNILATYPLSTFMQYE